MAPTAGAGTGPCLRPVRRSYVGARLIGVERTKKKVSASDVSVEPKPSLLGAAPASPSSTDKKRSEKFEADAYAGTRATSSAGQYLGPVPRSPANLNGDNATDTKYATNSQDVKTLN